MNVPAVLENDDDETDEINLIIFGIPRRIYERTDHLNNMDNLLFFQRFRVTKQTALHILDLIEERIEFPYNMNNCVSPVNQILVFLRFCATGIFQSCIADFAGVHPSTVSRIVVRVGKAIARLGNRGFMKMPEREAEIAQHQLEFYRIARFPRIIGAVDGTHIRTQSPGGGDAEIFRNRKGYFSINVQVVSDASLKILNVVARWPGSTHDSTIFNNSSIKRNFENNLYPNVLLLGDSGYPSKSYLLTPYLQPVTQAEQLYNESHIRTRNTVERMIGLWKRRFPMLAYGSRLKLDTILMVIVAVAVLHNICIINNEREPPDIDNVLQFQEIMEVDQVPNVPVAQHGAVGEQMRRYIIENYFAHINE